MGSAPDNLEVEVKFWVANLATVRRQLVAAGAELARSRVFERNVRYDNGWDGLARAGKLLRLRQDAATRLTYKGPPLEGDVIMSEARVREELEVDLSDFDTAHQLLLRLGFEARQVYEKYREAFHLGTVEVVLDELPFGDFVELEGPEAALRPVAAKLGLDWEERILANYLYLLEEMKHAFDLPFDDLTFANFAGVRERYGDLLER